MRFLAALLLATAFFGGAGMYAQAVRRRERLLRELSALFARIGDPHAPFLSDPRARFAAAAETGAAFTAAFLEAWRPGEDPASAWRDTLESAAVLSVLTAAERAALLSFADAFGDLRADAFFDACARETAFFSETARGCAAGLARSRRMALSFGALGAALIMILFV